MDIPLKNANLNLRMTMREIGYAEHANRITGIVSYERALQGQAYPRFHIYPTARTEMLVLALHLDQKQPSYQGTHAHGGEYDGPTVEAEAERIRRALHLS